MDIEFTLIISYLMILRHLQHRLSVTKQTETVIFNQTFWCFYPYKHPSALEIGESNAHSFASQDGGIRSCLDLPRLGMCGKRMCACFEVLLYKCPQKKCSISNNFYSNFTVHRALTELPIHSLHIFVLVKITVHSWSLMVMRNNFSLINITIDRYSAFGRIPT